MRANPDVPIRTLEEATKAINGWKGYMPFRNWCAILVGDNWEIHDSVRSAKRAHKKSGQLTVTLLSRGKD